MTSVSNANFGPLIAYLVPGATVLLGLSPFSPTLRAWLAATPADSPPTIGGFLYLTVASLAVGMTVSASIPVAVMSITCTFGSGDHNAIVPPDWSPT